MCGHWVCFVLFLCGSFQSDPQSSSQMFFGPQGLGSDKILKNSENICLPSQCLVDHSHNKICDFSCDFYLIILGLLFDPPKNKDSQHTSSYIQRKCLIFQCFLISVIAYRLLFVFLFVVFKMKKNLRFPISLHLSTYIFTRLFKIFNYFQFF